MKKKSNKGITLLALVITIVIILLLAVVALQLALGENGLIDNARKSKRENARAELFDIATVKFSSMSVDDNVNNTDTLNFNNLYNSNEFKSKYEIKNEDIFNKSTNEEIITKKEFEENFRIKFRGAGKETQKPLVDPINNNSNSITGVGEPGAEITVIIGETENKTIVGNDGKWSVTIDKQQAGTEIKIIQKTNGKIESLETKVVVLKEKLGKVTVNNIYNTSTNVKGKGEPGATVKVIDSKGNIKTGIVNPNGDYIVNIEQPKEDTIISVLQTMQDKEDSDMVTIIVERAKSINPAVNPVDSDDTVITGTGIMGSRIIVRIDVQEFTGTVDGAGNWSVGIPVQGQGKTIRVAQEAPRRSLSDEVVIIVTKALEPLENPQVNDVYNDHNQITGKGESGATIVVRVDGVGELRTNVDGAGNWRIDTQILLSLPDGRGIHVRQEKVGRPNSQEVHLTVKMGISREPEVIKKIMSISSRWKQLSPDVEEKETFNYTLIEGKGIPGSKILIKITERNGKHVWPLDVEHIVFVDGQGNWKFYVEYKKYIGFLNDAEIKQMENFKNYSVVKRFEIPYKHVELTMEKSRRRIR